MAWAQTTWILCVMQATQVTRHTSTGFYPSRPPCFDWIWLIVLRSNRQEDIPCTMCTGNSADTHTPGGALRPRVCARRNRDVRAGLRGCVSGSRVGGHGALLPGEKRLRDQGQVGKGGGFTYVYFSGTMCCVAAINTDGSLSQHTVYRLHTTCSFFSLLASPVRESQ